MNENFKIIKSSGDTQMGVGKNPFSSGVLVIIEDNTTKTWITLSPSQVKELIDNLKEENDSQGF